MMETSQILGWVATILFSIMLIPQIMKTIKTKDTSGVSLALFIIYFNANVVALIYAYMINQPPLILKYAIGIITGAIYITLFWVYYRKKKIGKVL